MHIPEYKTVGGIKLLDKSSANGEKSIIITCTNEEECIEFAENLKNKGFICHTAMKMPSGNDKQNNLFYTYTSDDAFIFVTFLAQLHNAYIFETLPMPLPSAKAVSATENTDLTLTQFKVTGMSYALQLGDGSFIIIDGGIENAYDAEELYVFLKDKSKDIPKISLWIFTHPDIDHIGLATYFLNHYSDKIHIEAFGYNFPDIEGVNLLYINTEVIKKDIDLLESAINKNFPLAKRYKFYTGQRYQFCGAEVEILWTGDLMYPHPYLSGNDMSIAFRIKFSNGKTALFLGDVMSYACRNMASAYREYLKSDIMQVTHHGLIGGDTETYKLIDPKICLWPTSHERFMGIMPGQKFQFCLGEGGCDFNRFLRDDTVRVREHYDQEKTVTISIN